MTEPSALGTWPTKENNNLFKYDGFYFELNQMSKNIERSTYSALDLLGDVGGLFDGLRIITSFLIVPISSLAVRDLLLS